MRWKFELADKDGNTIEIEEPIGWDSAEITLTRDKDWHGVTVDYSDTLQFYDDAFTFIQEQEQLYGVDAKVLCIVSWACDDTDDFEEVYTGRLNYANREYSEGSVCLAKINLEPSGSLMTFKNRYDQSVDLRTLTSYDGTTLPAYTGLPQFGDDLNLRLEPKGIFSVLKYDFADQSGNVTGVRTYDHDTIASGTGSPVPISHTYHHYIAFTNPVETGLLGYVDTGFNAKPFVADVPGLWVCPVNGNYTIDLKFGEIDVLIKANSDAGPSGCVGVTGATFTDYTIQVIADINGTQHIIHSATDTYCFLGGNPGDDPDSFGYDTYTYTNLSFNIGQTFNAGDYLKLYVKVTMSASYHRSLTVDDDVEYYQKIKVHKDNSYIRISGLAHAPYTSCHAFYVNEALSRVTEAITNDQLRVYSDYFGRAAHVTPSVPGSQPYATPEDGTGALECLTTGLIVRNQKDDAGSLNATLAISFKELFNGLTSIHNIGLGLEDDPNRGGYQMLRVEPIEYFYEDTVILVCDKVMDVKRTIQPSYVCSTFKTGYSKWQAEDNTGLDEFNTGREYHTNIETIQTIMDKMCKFIASGYALEITRQKQYDGSKKNDWRLDNDVFIICLKRDAATQKLVVEQGMSTATAITDLVDPTTLYNVRISPFRNLLRWMKIISAAYGNIDFTASPFKAAIFSTGDGNYTAATGVDNDIVPPVYLNLIDNETVNYGFYQNVPSLFPLYLPEIIEFEYPMSAADFRAIRANPKGIIKVRWGQNTDFADCYINEILYKPAEGMATYKLMPKYVA